MRCTRKLAKAVTLRFTSLTVKHETEQGEISEAEMAQRAHRVIGDTPKADDLTDRFENVDELILCSRGEKGWARGRD